MDDTTVVLRMTLAMLDRFGYRAIPVTSGAEALAVLDRENSLRIDLVLLDAVIENASGLETAQEIRRRRPGLPIVLMAGFPDNSTVSVGYLPVLQKPFTSPQLLRTISRVLSNPKTASAGG